MVGQRLWREKRRIWASIGVACVLGTVGMRAWSQDDGFRLLSGAIIGPKLAYVPLDVELVCGKRAAEISVSPDATDALIAQTAAPSARALNDLLDQQETVRRMEQGVPLEVNLLLWSFDSRRPATVWRGGGSLQTGFSTPTEVDWLPGTRTAIVSVMVTPPMTPEQMKATRNDSDSLKQTLTFVRINAANGKAQTLLSGTGRYTSLLTSKTDPVAVLVSVNNDTIQRVGVNGLSGGPLTLVKPEGKKEFPVWMQWLPDGQTLRGVLSERPDPDKPSKRTYYRLDTVTGAIAVEETAPAKLGRPAPVTDSFPFVVHQGHESLAREGIKTDVYPLWLEGRDKDMTGRTLIAADSDPRFTPILLTGAILYQKAGALYAVPLLKSNATDFLAKRLEAQKAETLSRAKQIGLAMMMYAQDYDENFPTVGSNLKDSVMPYVKNESVFQNPATGQNGFTPAYNNTSLSSFETPATTPLGYFNGPDGSVAVIYVDGHVKWR